MWVVQWCLNITKTKRKAVVNPQKGKEQKEAKPHVSENEIE
jgi:hypothetical protein